MHFINMYLPNLIYCFDNILGPNNKILKNVVNILCKLTAALLKVIGYRYTYNIYLSITAICCVSTAPSDETTRIDNRIDRA